MTHSGIDNPAIEPVDSAIAAAGLRTLYEHAERYRTVLYWRPIVPGLNDSDDRLARARELPAYAHATVFTGLFFRQEIADYYQAHGLPMPCDDTARRKIMPEVAEKRILDYFHVPEQVGAPWGQLYRKTSCAVAAAHGEAELDGAWIAAHGDYRALSAHLPGWEPAGGIDTLRLARDSVPGLSSYGLDNLIDHFQYDVSTAPDQRHRARFDAYATALLLLDLAGRYSAWDQLAAVAVPPGLPGAPQPEEDPTLW